ncbi:MAG: hypothetical protein ACJ77N_14970 [Chloroflexota bacterium]
MKPRSIPIRLAAIATVLAALASAAGLLIPTLYRDSVDWVAQARGTDLATLLVAVPVLLVGLCRTRAGSSAASLAVVAGVLYLVYNYAIFAFAVAMNPLTAVYIAILGLGVWSLILGALSDDTLVAGEAIAPRLARRASAGLLIGVGALFGLLWLGQIATFVMTGTVPPDLARAGIPTNPVYALDLAFFLPLSTVAGIGLLRGTRAGAFAVPMLMWVPIMGAGVLGGFLFQAAAGELVPIAVVALLVALSIASAILAGVPILRRSGQMRLGRLAATEQSA